MVTMLNDQGWLLLNKREVLTSVQVEELGARVKQQQSEVREIPLLIFLLKHRLSFHVYTTSTPRPRNFLIS